MLMFKAPDNWRSDCVFELQNKTQSIHRIGIIQVLYAVQANFVFTISYDQNLKGFDATNDTEFYCMKNPNKVIFTSIFWDNDFQELYISDELGFVWVLNVYVDKPVVMKQLAKDEKIHKIELMEEPDRLPEDPKHLLMHIDQSIKVY